MSEEKKEYNYGIAILKIWMCFEVVLFHFKTWDVSRDTVYGFTGILKYIAWYFKDIAVPVFMLLAFILTDIIVLSTDKEKRKKRLYRLIVPVLFWAIVYYIVIRIIDNSNGTITIHGISDLFWQIIAGHVYNKTLWFQSLLIIITVLFVLFIRLLKPKVGMIVCLLLGLVCLFLQYSSILLHIKEFEWPTNIAGTFFDKSYVVNTLGRLFEMIPYAALGMLLYKYSLFEKARKRIGIILISLTAIIFLLSFPVFLAIDGFYYQGIEKIVLAFFSVLFFYAIPFIHIPQIIKKAIRMVSSHIMAVYYMHRLIGLVLYNTSLSSLLNMKQGSLYDCVLIFLISLLFAFMGSKIPVKAIKESFS